MSSDSDSDFGKEASKTPKRRITDCLFDSDDEVLESPGREELRKLLLSDYEDVGSVTIDTPKLKNRNVRLRGAGRPQKGGDDYKDYGRSEMEQFLRLVSDKPFLWHTKDSDFHRKKEKGMPAWAEIERTCNTFMGKGRTPGKTAAALFKKMATTYKSHLTRIQKAPSGSAVTPKKDLFCYAELMSFMDEDITHRAPTWFVEKTLKYYFQLQFYSSFIVGAGPDVDVLPTETSSSKKK